VRSGKVPMNRLLYEEVKSAIGSDWNAVAR
jgi:hypothetical protein